MFARGARITSYNVCYTKLLRTLGIIAIAFVAQRWSGVVNRLHGSDGDGKDRWLGRFWSVVSGFTSFIAHAGGPPLSMYLIPKQMDRVLYVGTTAVFFAIINASKWLPYVWLDLLPRDTLMEGALLALISPLGSYNFV